MPCLPKVCPPGLYGADCSISCPSSCSGKGCHMNATCLGECPAGKQGENCEQSMAFLNIFSFFIKYDVISVLM